MFKSATSVLLGLVVCGLMLAPSSASAGIDRNNRCVSYAERYEVEQQTKFDVLFSKVVQGDRFFYGCVFSSEHARRLPGQSCCETDVASGFQLQGRYVAYRSLNQEPAATQANDTLYVYDVKTGQIKVQEPAVPPVNTSNSTFISSIVVKANGSVAWIGGLQTGHGQADYQVQTDDSTGTARSRSITATTSQRGHSARLVTDYRSTGSEAASPRTPRCSSQHGSPKRVPAVARHYASE